MGEWLKSMVPWLEKGTPVTLLILLVIGGLTLYNQHNEVNRLHDIQFKLGQMLLQEKDKMLELALRLRDCESPR